MALLPAGERRQGPSRRIGNETYEEYAGNRMLGDGTYEALTAGVITEELGKRGRKFAGTG
jgi:hypothetical protein